MSNYLTEDKTYHPVNVPKINLCTQRTSVAMILADIILEGAEIREIKMLEIVLL